MSISWSFPKTKNTLCNIYLSRVIYFDPHRPSSSRVWGASRSHVRIATLHSLSHVPLAKFSTPFYNPSTTPPLPMLGMWGMWLVVKKKKKRWCSKYKSKSRLSQSDYLLLELQDNPMLHIKKWWMTPLLALSMSEKPEDAGSSGREKEWGGERSKGTGRREEHFWRKG